MRILVLALVCIAPLSADEGLWPFNQFPKDAVARDHKFDATPEFLAGLQAASVRLLGGPTVGSGSFVSANGLVLTNEHLVTGCLGQRNLLKDGFYAAKYTDEVACPGLEAEVLLGIEDVTSQVRTGPNAKVQQRDAAIARVEKDCAAKTGARCNVVTLFSGGRYDLYRYRVYSDLRLVFAPENEVAAFGGQRDSITYLRYGLDAAFLRAYENGQPAATPHFFKWNIDLPHEDDFVMAVGNPLPTSRLATAAQLAFYRDTQLPFEVRRLQTRIAQVAAAPESPERQAVLNGFLAEYKVVAGKLIGLRDDRLVTRKTTFEGKIKRAVQASKAGTDGTKIWDEVATAYKSWTPFERPYQVLAAAPAPGSAMFRMALAIARGEQPQVQRTDASLETLLLTTYLEEVRALGEKDAPQKAIFGGRTPKMAAEAYVKTWNPRDPDNEMVHLAKLIDDSARKLAKKHDETIGALEISAAEKIAQYRFKLFGAADYPDATGTPRLEFGVVKGYVDRAGVTMPYASTFGGLFYRRDNAGPWQVPQRWVDLKPKIELAMPLNFVSTCDIGGGDAGSPVVNRAGELIGVTFDGNLESLPDIFLYSEEQARAVHVSTLGITEALIEVYGAKGLVDELGAKLPSVRLSE